MIIIDPSLLRVKCTDVLPEEIGPLKEALEAELKHSGERGQAGIGLAAPQIGIHKRMAIVRINKYNIDLVNCRIAAGFDPSFFDGEGCLSFPGMYERTYRFQEIYVVENAVCPARFIVTGLPAVVIQHELDHLDGILLPDRKK